LNSIIYLLLLLQD